MRKTTLTLPEAGVVVIVCFGIFTFWSVDAVISGFPEATFSDASNVWSIFLEVSLASIALSYLHVRGFDLSSLYLRPDVRSTATGLLLFVSCWAAGAILTSLFHDPLQPQVADFSFERLTLVWIVLFAMVNGAFEEVFLLGVLVRGLRTYGLAIAIGVPLLIRVLYHLYQGPLGVVWVLAFGIVLTLFYVRKMQLWPPVFAHTLWDIVPIFLTDA